MLGTKYAHEPAAFCIALAVMVSLAGDVRPGLAQGSAGGSIGKQNKSVSGSEEAQKPRSTRPRERSRAPARRQEATRPRRNQEPRVSAASSGASLTGTWRWSATCERGIRNYTGLVTLTQSGNTFTGTHGGTNIFDTGTITDGIIQGNQVRGTRIWGAYVDHVTLTLSGGRMSGTLPFSDHSGRCEMSFVKN